MPLTAAPESIGLPWAPPATFDQFTVLRPLGRGGMGHVYLGRDRHLDRFVALKFISSRNPASGTRERFLVEARAIARLSHPNVVSVYTIGEVEGRPYIAYEFVSGHSLDRLAVPLGWHMVLRLAVSAARGLEAAHAQGVLHRDLKPGNIILSERGEVKLLDFGLAKLEEPLQTSGAVIKTSDHATTQDSTIDGTVSTGQRIVSVDVVRVIEEPKVSDGALTRPGVLMGTPAYMASELWLGHPATQRTDIFALGLVIYELLVGALPHAGLDADETARRIVELDLPPLRSQRADVPESFAAIVDRTVRRDAAERFGSAAELRVALEELARVFVPGDGESTQALDPERVAIAASFARIREQGDAFVSRVYDRLFAADSGVRALFPADITAQKQKLLHMLGLAVGGPTDPERIVPVLEDLGRRHLHYAVEPRHFRALEDAIVGALAEHDAQSWDGSLEQAWRRGFRFIEGAMTRGMSSERATIGTDDSLTIVRWPRAPEPPPSPAQEVRTRYAANGDVSLAYQSFGSGSIDIVVLLGWLSHVELAWEHPSLANFLRRLARLGRVIIFDKRGTGLSDRAFEAASLQDRIDDMRAILEHAGVTRALFVGASEGASMAALFGALHPRATRGLVLYGGATGPAPGEIGERWGDPLLVELEAPSMQNDRAFRDWFALFMRMAASPGNAAKMLEMNAAFDIRGVLPILSAPTLVLHRRGDRVAPFDGGAHLAENIPGARFVPLEGDDHLPFVGDVDPILREIESFAREPRGENNARPLRVVLLAATRDGATSSTMERLIAPIAARHRGEHVDAGRGIAFAFDGAARAARAALAIASAARGAGVALGVALDAGVVGDAMLEALHARAIDVELQLPTATPLVRELAVGSNVSFTPMTSGLFAID